MKLDAQQRHVVNTIISVGRRRGVSRTEMLAALDTAGAEANFGNPSHGDGSSVGWRQETASSYPNVNRMDVQASVNRFFNETNAYLRAHGKVTPGVLAQGVQRSAYPARYRQFTGLAGSLLRGSGVTGAGGSSGSGGTPARNVRVTGRARVGASQIASLSPGDTGLAAQIASEIAPQRAPAPTAPLVAPSFSAVPRLAGGLTAQLQSGGPAPKSTALQDALLQASTDRGPDVSLSVPGASSTVSGTVHIPGRRGTRGGGGGGGGGPAGVPRVKGVLGLGKIAQSKFGLHVGENPNFGGVHPVHAPNSFHYKGEAIDVSGSTAKMRAFAHYVASNYGKHVAELFWQGPGGVNIKYGQHEPQGFVDGHRDHVHVAVVPSGNYFR